MRCGAASDIRTLRRVANASSCSQSRSYGLDVATSRIDSDIASGSTANRRARRSGTAFSAESLTTRSAASGKRVRAERPMRSWSSVRRFRSTTARQKLSRTEDSSSSTVGRGSRSASTGRTHRSATAEEIVELMPEGRGASHSGDGRNRAFVTAVTQACRPSSQSMNSEPQNPRNAQLRAEVRSVAPILLGALLFLLSAQPIAAQASCKALPAARQAIERGWAAYRTNDIAAAAAEFKHALSLCPTDAGALTGAGYAAMRQNELATARSLFARAQAADSGSYDAAAGAGMAAYRAGDKIGARRSFERALKIIPQDSTALAYMAQLSGSSTSVVLAARARPAVTSVAARTGRQIIETPDGKGGWSPMWIKAVNLGTALPGKFPSEFPPNDSTYEKWIALVAGMGANAIRVYTIHPPHFYAALRSWNLGHPLHPIWLIHGVWTEPPPGKKEENYDDPKWLGQFREEMRRVVALVHGDATIPSAPGHASGAYAADVSQWTIGYIIGREWEPYSVVAYNALQPRKTSFAGKFITIVNGNPLETWLTEQCDYVVSFEMERYNAQRPVAFTNWPTLDPLNHPTETGKAQEIALLKKRGEQIVEMSKEYDNDAVGLDAVKMRATPAFPAGVFASYHAYPYYPEFMVVDPGYLQARAPEGPSNYYGYLRELVEHHGDMPVVISEYGVPSSRGNAHVQPQGWNHGGLSEQQQAAADARLTRDIYASGAAGAGLFAVIDEGVKKKWAGIEFEDPPGPKRPRLHPLEPGERYGVLAMCRR